MGSSYGFKSTAIKWTYLQTCNGTYKPCWNWSVPAAIVPTATRLCGMSGNYHLSIPHHSALVNYSSPLTYKEWAIHRTVKTKGNKTSDSGEQKSREKSLNFIWRKGSLTFGAASWQQVNILAHCFSMVWEDGKGEIIHGTSNHIKFL